MINIYLNQAEKELDQMLARQKNINDYLRIAQDIYSVLEETEGHDAIKIIALFNVLKREIELEALEKNIELAQKTIKDLHNVRIQERKERIVERSNDIPSTNPEINPYF